MHRYLRKNLLMAQTLLHKGMDVHKGNHIRSWMHVSPCARHRFLKGNHICHTSNNVLWKNHILIKSEWWTDNPKEIFIPKILFTSENVRYWATLTLQLRFTSQRHVLSIGNMLLPLRGKSSFFACLVWGLKESERLGKIACAAQHHRRRHEQVRRNKRCTDQLEPVDDNKSLHERSYFLTRSSKRKNFSRFTSDFSKAARTRPNCTSGLEVATPSHTLKANPSLTSRQVARLG